ncbi:hypothetical protein Cch01nite_24680 [Cellulomonas chitinilytica]|uniref:Uncharacterized protein n=1 Tax=Cellulomonas chitinilytica TaxID=398759 RepID=A0A919U333_9CELL|nr:hypothetical protein [Cellulomonas chitinilytica]GIG21744.1 hypothetical protein Cch01nite_24680 [Cellulomonas chitinilytica]
MTVATVQVPPAPDARRHPWRAAAVIILMLGFLAAGTAWGASYTREAAYEQAYDATPHTVRHVAQAEPPAATADDHANAALATLYATDPAKLSTLQHALRRAGMLETIRNDGIPDQNTLDAIEAPLRAFSTADGAAAPATLAQFIKERQVEYLASIAHLVQPHTERHESHTEISESVARAQMWDIWRQNLGRAPTDAEVTDYMNDYNAASAANPEVTETEYVPAVDEDGLPVYIDGQQQYVSTTTTSSGGIG